MAASVLPGWRVAAVLAASAVLAGCHDNATAAAPQSLSDVRSAAQHEVEEARRRASEAYFDASRAVESARRELLRAAARGERDIARAQAGAEHAIGLKSCESMSHDARISCVASVTRRYQHAMRTVERIAYTRLD